MAPSKEALKRTESEVDKVFTAMLKSIWIMLLSVHDGNPCRSLWRLASLVAGPARFRREREDR